MKTVSVMFCLFVIGLFACNVKTNNISEHWFGSYNIYIEYGKLDEFSSVFIDYDVDIYKDSCEFSGMGYKTSFADLCKTVENQNELHIIYQKTIDGDGFTNHSKTDTLATLIKNGQKYYIKSSIIADKDWVYNKKLPLDKRK